MALLVRRQRQMAGGTSQAKEVNDAIKLGRLPQNALADDWGPILERRRRQVRLLRWLGPLEFGIFAALAVYLLVTDSSRVVLWIAGLAVFVGLAVWYPINSRRQLHGIQQLQQQMNTGASPHDPGQRDAHAHVEGEEPTT